MITARSRAIKLTHVRPAIDGGTADVRELSPCLAKRNTEGVDLPRIDFRISDVDLGETFGSGVATSAVYISNAKERFASCACGEAWLLADAGRRWGFSSHKERGGRRLFIPSRTLLVWREPCIFLCDFRWIWHTSARDIYTFFIIVAYIILHHLWPTQGEGEYYEFVPQNFKRFPWAFAKCSLQSPWIYARLQIPVFKGRLVRISSISTNTKSRAGSSLSLPWASKKFNICFALVEVFVLVEHSLELYHSLN